MGWYEFADQTDSIAQGEIVRQLSVVTYSEITIGQEEDQPQFVDARIERFNSIVLSQSCDLENGKIDNVMLCPIFDVTSDDIGTMRSKSKLSEVQRGRRPSYHLLERCDFPSYKTGPILVNFGQVFTVPFAHLKKSVDGTSLRIRLVAPYREDLAQAFARFVMRVGLPTQINLDDISS